MSRSSWLHRGSWLHRDPVAVAAAIAAPLALAALLVPFRTTLPNAALALVLVVVVVAIAANGHRAAGILSAVSAAVWFDFFLTVPYEHFTITHRADIETTVLLLVVGAAVTELAVRGRRQHAIAVTDESYLAAIAATTDLVASDAPPPTVIAQVTLQLRTLLGSRGVRFERTSLGGLPRLEDDGRLRWGEVYWEIDNDGLPDQPVEILARCNGRGYGRFVIDPVPGSAPPVAARQVACILVNQVAVALAHEARIDH